MNNITKLAVYYIEKWFKYKLYPGQKVIADLFFSKNKKITIKACTRYGKSQTIALCSIIYAIFYDNKRIGIIAPTKDKTKIIMGYILNALASCQEMSTIVDLDLMELTRLERLKREVSKQKITFKNGSSIEVLTADVKGRGFATMGRAFDLNIVDETAEIPDEVFSKIYRMLVENEGAKIIEIGNPWYLNHFYEHHNSGDWAKVTIDWNQAVEEGRISIGSIEDQRRNLSELEFKVLFDAEFPENIENSIFKKEYLDLAVRNKEFDTYEKILIGVDVAVGGKDYTVIVVIGQRDNEFSFIEYRKLDKQDTMLIVGEVQELVNRYQNPIIQIDSIGFGRGVLDRLRELGLAAYPYIAGSTARDKNRFFNKKSEDLFGLADIMKQGRFWNLPTNSQFILEARKITYEIRSDRLLKTIDPEDKSPDHLDALNIAMAQTKDKIIAFTLDI